MLVDALLDANRQYATSVALEDATRSLTYKQLTRLASVLRGIIQTETTCPRVGIMLPASTAFPATLFGTLWAGKIAIPLNFLLSAEELAKIIEDAGLDLLITVRHFEELTHSLPARAVFLEDLPLKRRMVISSLRGLPGAPKVEPDDTAVILYTSGTTGEPKGVELTQKNLHSNASDAICSLEITHDLVFLNILPPFHVFGLTANVLVPVLVGARVFAIPRFNPLAVIRAVRDKKISLMLAVPSMYGAILKAKSATRDDFASIRMGVSGGEPLPPGIADGFLDRFGVILREGYGLTETSPIISGCSPSSFKPGTVGKPVRNAQVRLVDPEGNDQPPGTDGEILVRGPGVMKGYYKRPEETARVLDDQGWFHTGDIGCFDEDGFLSITGRIKEMLIIAGENVFPREIEAALESHQAVLQAAVIGIATESRGEAPIAFVIPNKDTQVTPQQLKAHAKKSLAGFKVPKEIHIREDLPQGPTGKILKRRLKELI